MAEYYVQVKNALVGPLPEGTPHGTALAVDLRARLTGTGRRAERCA